MKYYKLFSIGILAIALPLLSSCNSNSNKEEDRLFDYWWENYCVGQGYSEEPEVIGTDKQGIEYSLMESGRCYAYIDTEKLFTYANESSKNDILIEIPSSFKKHTVVGFLKCHDTARYVHLNEGKTLSLKLPSSIEYIGPMPYFSSFKIKLLGIPENIQYIGSRFSGCFEGIETTEYENGFYIGPKNNPYFCLDSISNEATSDRKSVV